MLSTIVDVLNFWGIIRKRYKVNMGTVYNRGKSDLVTWCKENVQEGFWGHNYELKDRSLDSCLDIHNIRMFDKGYNGLTFWFYNREDRDLFALVWKGNTR